MVFRARNVLGTFDKQAPGHRFESVIVGETSGKRNFHNQKQIIYESRLPHEINHTSQAFRYSQIMFLSK